MTSTDVTTDADRPLRADAQRNRDRIVDTARVAFAELGDAVALETIARDAQLGIGTLYRHFPTRGALLEAVYAAELASVTSNSDELLGRLDPEAAMRTWMARYAEFIATKREMLPALGANGSPDRRSTTRQRINTAIGTLLAAGVAEGRFRDDVEADDLTSLLRGASLATAGDQGSERVGRLLDLIVDTLLAPRRPTTKD